MKNRNLKKMRAVHRCVGAGHCGCYAVVVDVDDDDGYGYGYGCCDGGFDCLQGKDPSGSCLNLQN